MLIFINETDNKHSNVHFAIAKFGSCWKINFLNYSKFKFKNHHSKCLNLTTPQKRVKYHPPLTIKWTNHVNWFQYIFIKDWYLIILYHIPEWQIEIRCVHSAPVPSRYDLTRGKQHSGIALSRCSVEWHGYFTF